MSVDRRDFKVPPAGPGWYDVISGDACGNVLRQAGYWNGSDWAKYPVRAYARLVGTFPTIDRATGAHRLFATGLRNPNGLQWEPQTEKLWAVVNERDELGPNLVPDYLTSVQDGAFYGWPYSYYGQHIDPRVMPQRPDLVAKAIPPDYAIVLPGSQQLQPGPRTRSPILPPKR
jgi:hypothetical protein